MASKIEDCYYYYYSTCSKGNNCSFRHEPAALKNETMCVHWLKGRCIRPRCNFRHMEIKKNRNKIPCFHENQPGGCQKDHCPFLHGSEAPADSQGSSHVNCIKSVSDKDCSKQNEVKPFAVSRKLGKDHQSKQRNPLAQSQGANKSNTTNGSSGSFSVFSKNISLTPFELVKCLSEFSGLTATLLMLLERFGYTPTQVKTIVADNSKVFQLEGESVSLRPKVDICPHYLDATDCKPANSCKALHICRGYVMGQCKEEDCLFGHSFSTNHNKLIVNDLKLSLLSPSLLFTLFSCFVFVTDLKKKFEVCQDYNEGKCQKINCVKLHMCLQNLAGCCTLKERCTLNHDIFRKEVSSLLSQNGINVNESPRDILMNIVACPLIKQIISKVSSQPVLVPNITSKSADSSQGKLPTTTIWSDDLNGEVVISEICYNSVVGLCPFEDAGCQRLHSSFHFYWQVKSTSDSINCWTNLTNSQVDALEKVYCDPATEKTYLPVIDTTTLKSSSRGLLLILNGKSKWEVNFTTMQLTLPGQKHFLSLRRLCTEHTANPLPEPSVFLWYFLDKNDRWIAYGNEDSTGDCKLKVDVNSDSIEKQFRQNRTVPLSFKSELFAYSLDFSRMLQTNVTTNVTRKVRRRPMPHFKDVVPTQTGSLPDHWETMQPTERVRRVKVPINSEEYKNLVAFIQQQQRDQYKIHSIERVQNLYFWRAFHNKVQEMTSLYNNIKAVNVQQLFHGTNPDIVPKICEENFDWRLHGSNVGQAYGRGTYFSPYPSTAYGYTKADLLGQRYMFVAKVAVGSTTLGNSSMKRPPINPQTKLPFDSTVDNLQKPSIIVKYDKQEYFPEYILTLA